MRCSMHEMWLSNIKSTSRTLVDCLENICLLIPLLCPTLSDSECLPGILDICLIYPLLSFGVALCKAIRPSQFVSSKRFCLAFFLHSVFLPHSPDLGLLHIPSQAMCCKGYAMFLAVHQVPLAPKVQTVAIPARSPRCELSASRVCFSWPLPVS